MRPVEVILGVILLPAVTLAQVRFPGEVVTDDLEVRLEARADVVRSACLKYSDPTMPESKAKGFDLNYLHHKKAEVIPSGDYVTLSGTNPQLMMCAPRSSGLTKEALMEFKTAADEAFPVKKDKKKASSAYVAEGQVATVDAKGEDLNCNV